MKQLGCMRASMLLERRAAGLTAAEALRLEEHLTGCEPCSSDAHLLGNLRALSHTVDGTLAPQARARVIVGALARAQAGRTAIERSRVHASLRLGAAFAAAALLVVLLRTGVLPVAEQPASTGTAGEKVASAKPPAVPVGDHVVSGTIELDGRVLEGGAALASNALVHATGAARVVLAHANVELRAGSDVRWNGAARVLRLDRGSVVADVDPTVHRTFEVETARFRVLVLGTRFEVTQDAVRVERGRVRVVSPAGVLAAELGAGDSYSASDAAADKRAAETHARRTRGSARSAAHDGSVQPPHADALELLETARAELGQKQIARARQTIEDALALAPEPRVRGEALTLRAECALVEGDQTAAVEAYLRVARTFAAMPAGENALFAAARIEAERGRSAAAAQLLERYLERYPHGRFEREAHARLRTLSAALDRAP